jgi:hypothetical protein
VVIVSVMDDNLRQWSFAKPLEELVARIDGKRIVIEKS